jgi:hypothetical protein
VQYCTYCNPSRTYKLWINLAQKTRFEEWEISLSNPGMGFNTLLGPVPNLEVEKLTLPSPPLSYRYSGLEGITQPISSSCEHSKKTSPPFPHRERRHRNIESSLPKHL